MKRVERGSFSEELRATGNDEIDVLTRQFNSMVQQLAQHDATIRDLNANLERKVEERTLNLRLLHAELDQRNTELETALTDVKQMQSQLVEVAHRAGMTEIAAGVLHNVGNVLNSVNVSVSVLNDSVRTSKVASVARVAALVKEHAAAFAAAGADPKVQRLPEYLGMLADSLAEEQRRWTAELQQPDGKSAAHQEHHPRAAKLHAARLLPGIGRRARAGRGFAGDARPVDRQAPRSRWCASSRSLPRITVEKSKLLQVLDNLIKNALEAMAACEGAEHTLRITTRYEVEQIIVSIADTGHGISDDQLKHIFRFGFTTKAQWQRLWSAFRGHRHERDGRRHPRRQRRHRPRGHVYHHFAAQIRGRSRGSNAACSLTC